MKVTAFKTHKITTEDRDILKILDKYIPKVKEKSILAVTSKIISICEGRVIKTGKVDKMELVKKESQYYLPPSTNKYNVCLTLKDNIFIASAGIDESNGNGYYILWPKNSQNTANKIRKYLAKKYKLKNFGVIITDSKLTPLRRGVTGVALSYSGFLPLKNYIDEPDIFGRNLHVTKANIMDGLAASAVFSMGEGKEQTPLAIIEDIPFVEFQKRNPSKKELEELKISLEEDIFAPFIKGVKWKKGDLDLY